MTGRFTEVIGDPVNQSKSPLIHRFWLEKLGIDATYRANRVEPADLAGYLENRRDDENWLGCNVTMPHKQDIVSLLGSLDPAARRLGAVNTVVRDPADGSLRGFNTDGAGFLEPLAKELAKEHLFRMARVMGTGGAARAIIAALAQQGFTLVVAGRDPDKARALLDDIVPEGEHHAIALGHFAPPTDFAFDDRAGCLDLVVNASPLGMEGFPPLAFDWSHAPPGSIAYDIVTTPHETPFLADARASGHRVIDGLAMLIGQAAIAFEKFFGVSPPREHDPDLRALLLK